MIIAAAAILFFVTTAFIMVKLFYDKKFPRFDKPEFCFDLKFTEVKGVSRTPIQFRSGKNTLRGHLYGADNHKGIVVIAHGLKSGSEEYLAETLYFVRRGWRVFTYDCTGSHESEGKGTKGLSQSLLDLHAALSYIEENKYLNILPIMLYGHSWGGYAAAAVLNYKHDIAASVSLAGYNSPIEMFTEHIKDMIPGFFAFLLYPFGWLYQVLLFGKAGAMTAVSGINCSGAGVMIIHGTGDNVIKYGGASIIAHKAQITNPKTFYMTCSDEHRNGHSDLHMTAEANLYRKEKDGEFRALSERFGGRVPREAIIKFYEGVDKAKANELDMKFMGAINAFFEGANLRKNTGTDIKSL
ncbi:MAG: Alpha/beta hydrolase family protein [Firmicutes bacterium ADurb.Bin182]|nr:MAG: Alpha/beta hydrolase family protein [Firmicutes bacterium ADurb.Bin182]